MSKGMAVYLGNPATCELPQEGVFLSGENKVALKVGYQTQSVLDRKMEVVLQPGFLGGCVDQIGMGFDQGVLVFNIIDRLEVVATLGSMRLSLDRTFTPNMQLTLESHSSFVWSIGGQTMLILWDSTSLGVVANYLSSNPTPEIVLFNRTPYLKDKTHISYDTWQIEVALSQKVDVFSVYLGAAYSYAQLKIVSDLFQKIGLDSICEENYKNRHSLSMIMGVSLAAHKAFTMTFEAQAFGQTAIGMRMEFRF
ncbi:MAG: hypothetical protein WCG10_07035 [Chlamydiota bacterium]